MHMGGVKAMHQMKVMDVFRIPTDFTSEEVPGGTR
jgi:hypothetical protein